MRKTVFPTAVPLNPEYLRRKTRELRLLSRFAEGGTTVARGRYRSFDDLHGAKLEVRDSIRARAAKQGGASESNLLAPWSVTSVFGFDLSYDYQRQRVDLCCADALRAVYPGLSAPRSAASRGMFTSSCQGAISVLFETLKRSLGDFEVVARDGAYWETLNFWYRGGYRRRFGADRKRVGRGKTVLYHDSSAEPEGSDGPDASDLSRCALLVVDTTCYELSSPRLGQLIKRALSARVPCFLLRSHMKLDSLGMEYGRLGSAVLVHGRDLPRARRAFCERLWEDYREAAGAFGVAASISQLYPFHRSREMQRAGLRRIEQIRANHARVRRELLESGCLDGNPRVSARFFRHGFFFWIEIRGRLEKAQATPIFDRLSARFEFAGVPYRYVSSYPWDFLGLTSFRFDQETSVQDRETTVLRVSIGDFDPATAGRAGRCLSAWIGSLPR